LVSNKVPKAIITKATVDSSATYCEIRCAMSGPGIRRADQAKKRRTEQ
jgi:hypothetical protein